MNEEILKINHVSKQYRLGMIGGTTLRDELQRRHAARKGLEDPTRRVTDRSASRIGETFMALDDINITVHRGERVGIIGHNGAGKSTLLKLISRITAPSTGTIEMNGRVASMLEVGTGFHAELTGRENIYMNGAILGMTRKEIDAKIEDIIEFSECRQFIDTPVKRYSSGMYVKLAFSVAAHLDSEIMIMDEVLAVGDMAFQKKCLDKMNDVSKTQGRTILYVSHNMNTIRQLCERCIVLNHGKVVFDGDVESGIERYMNTERDLRTVFEFNERQRHRNSFEFVRMIQLNILDRPTNQVVRGDSLLFSLAVQMNQSVVDNYFRLEIAPNTGTIHGTCFSVQPFFGTAGEIIHVTMKLDTANFAPGFYTCDGLIYQVDKFGGHTNLEKIDSVMTFEVIPREDDIAWPHRYWGYTRYPDIEIVSVG